MGPQKRKAADTSHVEEKVQKKDPDTKDATPAPPTPPAAEKKEETADDAGELAPPVSVEEAKESKEPTEVVPVTAEASAEVRAPKPLNLQTKRWALSGGEDGHLRLWDFESFQCVRVFEAHPGAVNALAVNWGSMEAVSGGDDSVRLWDLKQGGCQKSFSDSGDWGGSAVLDVQWDMRVVIAGCRDGQLRFWDIKSGNLERTIQAHPGGVSALSVDWERRRVSSGGDVHMKMWNLDDFTCLQKVSGHPGGIMSLSTNFEESVALVGSAEQSLKIWNLDTKTPRNLLGHREPVAHVTADWVQGLGLSAGWDAQIRIWDLEKASLKQKIDCKFGRVRSIAADLAQMKATCGGSNGFVHLVDLRSGSELRSVGGHIGAVTAVCAKL